MRSLLLCAGSMKKEGYVTLDAYAPNNPDILAEVPPLPDAVKSQPWDLIEWIHGIEHFPERQGQQLLKECYEILAPGGLLVLEQPNLWWCMRVVLGLEPKPPEIFRDMWGMAGIFGDQRYEGEWQNWMQHKWGYWPESLEGALREVGFTQIARTPVHYHEQARDFRLEARKP